MKFDVSPDLKQNIYNEYLHEISGVKFTPREIDIIACILHNRGEKKIASLLAIAYRTVGVHVRNIMNKLGCNSKEYIIDAVEKSGKLQYFRQYYFYLVAELSFIKILQKITKLITRSRIQCNLDFAVSSDENTNKQLKQIKEHLSWANILLTDTSIKNENASVNLFVLSNDIATRKNLKQYNLRNGHNKTASRDIALVFEANDNDLALLKNMQYIDFASTKNYYFSILELIKQIIGIDEIEKLIQEFKDEYEALQNSWRGVDPKQTTQTTSNSKTTNFKILNIVVAMALVGTILSTIFIIYSKNNPDIKYLNAELANFALVFSADSITTEEEKKRNYTLVKKVSKVVDNFTNKDVQEYFQNGQASHDELINCLFVFHALGTHYVYHEHDGIKARELLKIAKNIAELYVTHQHDLYLDFEGLTPEEIYTELAIFKDLPEMYAKIVYLLGKTYMYQGDLDGTDKYFELSKYLGNRLGIFEGYLSTRSGTEMTRRSRIESDIKNGEYKRAQKNLLEAIKVLAKIREDKREYKITYRPGNINPQIIIPSEDVHNQLFIDEEIVKAYSRLIMTSTDAKRKQEYAKKILDKFLGSKSAPGMLAKVGNVVSRRVASVYNDFGNILLQLDREDLDFYQYKKEIMKELNLQDGDKLNIILQIFNLAKINSRNNEHTKADSYNGSARVKERMISTISMSSAQKTKLENEISELKAKRDEINTRLKRKIPLFP